MLDFVGFTEMTISQDPSSLLSELNADYGRVLVVLAVSGGKLTALDMAYPALIMANGALTEGIETHIFFTFWGLDMINKKTQDHLQFTMLGNTAMHMPGSAKHIPQGFGGCPARQATPPRC